MKKLIAVILILAMLLPVAALAEEKDPIVGFWYALYDTIAYPEMKSWINGADYSAFIFFFSETGEVFYFGCQYTGLTATPFSSQIGKWKRENGKYLFDKIGYGSGFEGYILEDFLIAQIGNGNDYFKLIRMDVFNPYTDLVYAQ